jgi:hypothetical protein
MKMNRPSLTKGKAEPACGGMKIYLSGPISGKADFNSKAFLTASDKIIKECGCLADIEIINPLDIAYLINIEFIERGNFNEPAWEDYMKRDIIELIRASCVYLLDGWRDSRGANIEQYLALVLNIPCSDTIDGLKRIIEKIKIKETENETRNSSGIRK